jgi:hypothetical protein
MRRLLPYERALIDTLAITEEEYFRFIAYQEQYKDIKDGTIFDVRMGTGAEWALAAAIISIVGTVAQVAATLLAPKPQIDSPDAPGSRRERRFNPRFGFDSAQDLAQYGSPVNLVYTDIDTNPNGGVRAATSLLWSAVHSYGARQYMQILAAVGSSDIVEISAERIAFGQTPARQFVNTGNWFYFRSGGPITFNNLLKGDSQDPSRSGRPPVDTVYKPYIVAPNAFDGFSQSFSPSSFSSFGIESPIPINVDVYERETNGSPKGSNNRITVAQRGAYWPGIYGTSRLPFPIGHRIVLEIAKNDGKGNIAEKQAEEDRLVAASSMDVASIYKLGSAKFKVVAIDGDDDLDSKRLNVTLECFDDTGGVNGGYGPLEDYATQSVGDQEQELSKLLPTLKANLKAKEDQLALNMPITITNLTASQQSAFSAFNKEIDTIEGLVDDIAYVVRTPSQMDEYVLENRNLFPGEIIKLADDINTLENEMENEREEIVEERKRPNPRTSEITRRRVRIADLKVTVRDLRKRLEFYIRDRNFADQKLFNYLSSIETVVNDVQRQFSRIEGYQVINDTDLSDIVKDRRALGALNAIEERRILKRVRNRMRQIESRIASLIQIDYPAMDRRNQALANEISSIQRQIAAIETELASPESLNDYLATKCLVKISQASYETISACKVVNFAIKGKAFMRVQGRQKTYGEVNVDGYRNSDNGLKFRSAFFLMFTKEASAPDSSWRLVPRVFVLRRAADNEFFFPIYFDAPDNTKRWAFRFEPVFDVPSEALKYGALRFAYLNAGQNLSAPNSIDIPGIPGAKVLYFGSDRAPGRNNLPPKNKSPFALDEWALYSPSMVLKASGNRDRIAACSSDCNIQFSFDSGPEFEITAVTEQQNDPNYAVNYPDIYAGMSLAGFNSFSGKEIKNLKSLSVFVTKGKRLRRITGPDTNGLSSYPINPDGQSNYAPDIFLDTVLDKQNGIGQFADPAGIDIDQLGISKRMCRAMGYFMDGVIADARAWREFWAEIAPYSMLEFARIGGRDTLIPALPVDATGRIYRQITISALFNQGNILEDSYKEEFLDYGDSTQDIIATVIYRAPERDGVFPQNTSLTLKLADADENDARRVSFDLSQFVTSRTQALHYGMMMCMQRRYVRRAVEFKTFPTEAPVKPGAYIYVQTDENRWDNIKSGVVEEGGVLNLPLSEEPINGTFSVLIYDGADEVKSLPSVNVSNSVAASLAANKGWLFVLGTQLTSKRVFKVVEVEMDEQGEVTIRANEHPCVEEGGITRSLIARQAESLFTIDG